MQTGASTTAAPARRTLSLAQGSRELLLALDRFDARRVLDLGCGDGWFSAALARCGFDVCGLGCDPRAMDTARRLHPDVRFIDFASPTGADEVPPAGFDAALIVESLDELLPAEQTLALAGRLLRPGGLLLLVHTPEPDAKARWWRGGRSEAGAVRVSGGAAALSARVRAAGFDGIAGAPVGRLRLGTRPWLLSARRAAGSAP